MGLDKVASLSVGFVILKLERGAGEMGWDKIIRSKFKEKEREGWVYNLFPSKGQLLGMAV